MRSRQRLHDGPAPGLTAHGAAGGARQAGAVGSIDAHRTVPACPLSRGAFARCARVPAAQHPSRRRPPGRRAVLRPARTNRLPGEARHGRARFSVASRPQASHRTPGRACVGAEKRAPPDAPGAARRDVIRAPLERRDERQAGGAARPRCFGEPPLPGQSFTAGRRPEITRRRRREAHRDLFACATVTAVLGSDAND